MLAAEAGDERGTAALLAAGADPNRADVDGHTPLMRASFHGHMRVASALLRSGAQVDAADGEGCTALHHAGRGAQEFAFDVLELKHGADPTVRNKAGECPALREEPCRVS